MCIRDRFHAEYYLMIIFITCYSQKFHRTFYHADRRVAIAAHDAVAQRAVVGANAHGCAILFTNLYKRRKALANAVYFGSIFAVGIFYEVKLLFVDIVTRVYAHFFYQAGGNLCCICLLYTSRCV